MSDTATILRGTRSRSGLSQTALAKRARIAQPNLAVLENGTKDARLGTITRVVEAAGEQLTTLPTREVTVADAAAVIAGHVAAGQRSAVIHRLVALHNGLVRSAPDVRVALCVTAPDPTGDAKYDAFLASLVEHDLARLPVPAWAKDTVGRNAGGWYVDDSASDQFKATIRKRTPPAFRRHGVWIDAAELARVVNS